VIDASRRVTGVDFPEVEGKRRPGDPPELYNDPSKITAELGWSARYDSLDAIIETAWRWFREHPGGYSG
jgi:UDP-glucose 4-epimerase